MRTTWLVVLLAWGVPSWATHAAAQSNQEAVREVVDAFFDAMRDKDEEALRALVVPDARFFGTVDRGGRPALRLTPVEDFIRRVVEAGAHLDERIWDVEVRVEDNLATVWSRYNLFVDGELDHCGVDAFQLFRSAEGWKVFHVADTYSREGCSPGQSN